MKKPLLGWAVISDCKVYRYELGRDLSGEPAPVTCSDCGHPVASHHDRRCDSEHSDSPVQGLLFGPEVRACRCNTSFPSQAEIAERCRLNKTAMFLLLNPSKANATDPDPTVTRCIDYAIRWGYRQLLVGNAYAYRSTKPEEMFEAQVRGTDIVGPQNNIHLIQMMERAKRSGGVVVAGWGGNCSAARAKQIRSLAETAGVDLLCLKHNNDGSPVHPLYQPKTLMPFPWAP